MDFKGVRAMNTRDLKPRGPWRVLHTSDMGTYFRTGTWLFGDPATPEDIRAWVAQLAQSGVDAYVQEVYFDGFSMFYRTDRCDYGETENLSRFDQMMEDGVNPLDIYVDEARKQGMPLLAGFRMNDRHGNNEAFFKAHPDWMIEELGHGVNFALQQVQDWFFAIVEEVPDRFDVDGIELNFTRHGFCFPPATSAESHLIMTDLMRRLRAMLDRTGETKGRKLLFGVRVPPSLSGCIDLGFDIPTWIDEGIIDFVAPTSYHRTDYNAQYDEFVELARRTDCLVYPALEGDVPGRVDVVSMDQCRAAVHNFNGAGADGFSTHNYDAYTWGQRRSRLLPGVAENYPAALDRFKVLKDASTVAAGNRHYLFHPLFPEEHFPNGYRGAPIPHIKAVLPRNTPDASANYRFRVCEDLPDKVDLPVGHVGRYSGTFNSFGKIPGAWLIFRAIGMVPGDRIKVSLNGTEVPDEHIRHIWFQEGRPHWEGRTLPPFTECRLTLTSPPSVYGDNILGLELFESATDAKGDIVVDELEVIVHVDD